jgi:hypothetical protein
VEQKEQQQGSERNFLTSTGLVDFEKGPEKGTDSFPTDWISQHERLCDQRWREAWL